MSLIFRFLIFFVCLLSCTTKKQSNFQVGLFEGLDLNGKVIKFAEIKDANRIALNVYSPSCTPCVEEIPALNYINKLIQTEKLGKLYMVVDPYSIVDEDKNLPFHDAYSLARKTMEEEVSKHNILLDVIIMKKPFKILPQKGLITGTPETLLLKTDPLVLYYNFIGPISSGKEEGKLQNDPKVLFFKRMMGGI